MRILAWPAFRKQAANPHAALLCQQLRELGVDIEDWTPARAWLRQVDLWHLHHPDTVVYPRSVLRSLLGTLAFAALLSLARRRGTRMLWTVHDLDNNDALHPRLEAWFWRFFLPRIDACICLSEAGRRLARQRFPQLEEVPSFVIPHGHYRDAYPGEVPREDARRQLDLPADATVLLHFGLMRPYKGVAHLIRAFRQLREPGAILVAAGRPFDRAVEREVRASAEGCPQVRLLLRWIAPAEIPDLFAACNLVVLPYRRILNSGAAMLALSFARPVLLPDLGAMREQQERFGAEWVRLYSGELTPEELAAACRWVETRSAAPGPDLSGLDWRSLAVETRAVYQALVTGIG